MNFILLGKPGAGKGSLSLKMVDDGYVHLSTGDMFRKEIASKSELGLLADSYISKGNLVPDEVTNEIVMSVIKNDTSKSYLFDGYPRTINQAEALDNALKELGLKIDVVIDIDSSNDVIIERLSNRRMCKDCGSIYHAKKIENPDKCPKCGGDLYTREDDKKESVLNRLDVYEAKTKPLIDYYKNKNLLVTFDGNCEIDELYKVVNDKIDEMISLSSQNL